MPKPFVESKFYPSLQNSSLLPNLLWSQLYRGTGRESVSSAVSSKLVAGSVKSVNGKNSDVIKEGRFAGVQALSGTGYCSLFAEFQKHCCPESPMYLPDPTWSKQVCLVSSVISQVLSLKRLLAMREVFLVLYKQPRSSSPNWYGIMASSHSYHKIWRDALVPERTCHYYHPDSKGLNFAALLDDVKV